MDKDHIATLLDDKYNTLISWLENQNDDQWETGPEGKWTTSQQALHLLQSVKMLNNAVSMPKFMLKYKFGKANRDVRDYETVCKRYDERLVNAKGKTFKGFENKKVPKLKDKPYFLKRLQIEQKKLQAKTLRWKDNDLDTFIIPHPLMGKMPVREIIMWSAYHVEHHTKTLQNNY
jgi:hypothetical protein